MKGLEYSDLNERKKFDFMDKTSLKRGGRFPALYEE